MSKASHQVTGELKSSAIKYIVGALAGTLISAITVFLKHFVRPLYDTIMSQIPKDVLIHAANILLLVILLCFVWIILLYRERKTPLAGKYKFNEYGGYYLDPKNGQAVCPSCLSEGKIVHMMDVSGNKMCNACKTTCRGKKG